MTATTPRHAEGGPIREDPGRPHVPHSVENGRTAPIMTHPQPVTVEVPVAVLRGLADEHMRKSIVINQLLMDAGVDLTGIGRPAAPVLPATVVDLTAYRAARGA